MGFFSEILRPRAQTESFDTVTAGDWYERNGYRMPFFGSMRSDAGETVGQVTSLQLSTVYACVKITAEDVGSQPIVLMRRDPQDRRRRDRATDDLRYRLLHDAPNPDMGAGEFQEAITARACLMGTGAALIENFGRPTMALWPLCAEDTIRLDKDRRRRTVWIVKEGNAAERTYNRNQVFVVRGFTFDGRQGDKILYHARQAIGLGLAAQRYAAEFLKNDPGAALFLEHPSNPGGPEGVLRILKAWRDGGSGRADWPEEYRRRQKGDPRVLTEGMKANRLDPDLEKQQLVETRKHQIEEIARMFRMPLHKLAHLDRMTFNNVEELQIDYDSAIMNPWRRRWREAVYRHLLTDNEQTDGRLYADLVAEAMLRGNFQTQTEGFRKLFQSGVYSPNDIRSWLNLNPVEGGDSRFIQMQFREIGKLAAAAVTK